MSIEEQRVILDSKLDTHAVADMLTHQDLGEALIANLESGDVRNLIAIEREVNKRVTWIVLAEIDGHNADSNENVPPNVPPFGVNEWSGV